MVNLYILFNCDTDKSPVVSFHGLSWREFRLCNVLVMTVLTVMDVTNVSTSDFGHT